MIRTAFTRKAPPPRQAAPAIGKPRMKSCKVCRARFEPRMPLQVACGLACAIADGKKTTAMQKAKAKKIERAEDKAKLKTRQDWQREAQAAINAYVRARDAALPCISCGRHHEGQYHAGHYLARGSHPHLALVELNLAKQCAPCNTYLSGNQLKFRVGLIERIGLAAVETLEADQAPRRHTIDDLREIRDTYRKRAAQLKKEMS